MAFDAGEYEVQVRLLRKQLGNESFPFADALYHLACECKLAQEPPLPFTREEVECGLRGALYRSESRASEELLDRLRTVLPFLVALVPPRSDPDQPLAWQGSIYWWHARVFAHLVTTAGVVRDLLTPRERAVVSEYFRRSCNAACDEVWIRNEWERIHEGDEWRQHVTNPGIADVGEALALLELWGEEVPRGHR